MNALDLKNSILQLAIQGKLVEQREEEGTAKELLEQIKDEKEQLIKDKKIKKSKTLPEINEDEIPFDIPKNWEWSRLEFTTYSIGNKTNQIKQSEILQDGKFPVVSQSMNRVEGFSNEESKLLKIDPLSVIVFGDHSKTLKLIDFDFIIGADGTKIMVPISLNPNYLYYVLNYNIINMRDRGYSRHFQFLKEKLLPIPPLQEQQRIVAKIEELMPYVEKYDRAYSEVEELNKKFTEDIQKSILQYAIQGKLVEQKEEEGTAEELFQQIREVKAKLVKEGKIKKGKPLLEIAVDEILFEIPDSWKWVRLGDLVSFYGGYAYKSSTYVNESNNMIIRLGNVKNDKLLLEINPVFIPQDIADATSKYKILPEDILFTMTGTRKKRDYFYTSLIDENDLKQFELFLNQRVGCLRNDCKKVDIHWLSFALKSECILSQIFLYETGTANQGNIGSDNTMSLMIPLPPFEEQKRIVEKIEELLPYTKQLVK